ncbi:MAG: class I SAM-dependent methyltransferase [Flavobacteriaceae bacterium]|nr:class I SAM-dependent methyltransferase [Flavobacteriaceae bacterium]
MSKNNPKDFYITTKDFLVTGESFSLVWDDKNLFLRTTPQPQEKDLSKYYESSEYISHTDSKKGLLNFSYQLIKKYSLNKKVKLIKKENNQKGTLLDIGAGTGDFLFLAQNKGWKIDGVEVNEKAQKLAFDKGIVLKKNLDELKNKSFDVITLWHVLEHLPNLHELITQIENKLKPGGTLIIAVPNFKSLDASYYKVFWAAYDVPRHLWHFSKESMKQLFSSNLKLIKTKPMIFDAFYVSLLSEKYKTGKAFSLKALWIGLRSNLSAWKTKEYSSLIYIFKKHNG